MDQALGAMFTQLAPTISNIMNGLKPLMDQPIVRFPYVIPLSASQVIQPGQTATLTPPDFNYSFEWPFEVWKVAFSNDPSHSFRDWRVAFTDQTFSQPWQKSTSGVMVSTLLDANTDKWCLEMPWVIRPKGGGLSIQVTNLDTVNPITVDIALIGKQLLPRSS